MCRGFRGISIGRCFVRGLGGKREFQVSNVGDLVLADGAQLIGTDTSDSDRFAIKGNEFDLKTLSTSMDHYNRANIAGLKTFSR